MRAHVEELRAFAVSRLRDLRGLLGSQENIAEARGLLAEHIGHITLWPVNGKSGTYYEAKGMVDFFGDRVVRAEDAGGPAWTAAPIIPLRVELAVAA